MTPENLQRYARHLVLKEIGGPGQQALLATRAVIIGAGGLGGPAGLYLAAAGIGNLTIIDDDKVELSNLQRQVQFSQSDIGTPKAETMKSALSRNNPDLNISYENVRLDKENAENLLSGHHIILDGTDSFETRFLVNTVSRRLNIPLISGAIGRFDGQVSVFNTDKSLPCYQCLVPQVPPQAETCSEVGVVGALAGVIGSMMALEAIKHVTGAGETLAGRLWIYDGLQAESRTVRLAKDPACSVCA